MTLWATVGGAIALLPGVFTVDIARALHAADWKSVGGLLYLIVFGSAVANVLWYRGVAAIGAVGTSVTLFLEPAWGLALAWLLLSAQPTGTQIVGVVLITAGLLAALRRPARGERADDCQDRVIDRQPTCDVRRRRV
ncbi:MAG: EamA family transporter [Actinokineospora sp.]